MSNRVDARKSWQTADNETDGASIEPPPPISATQTVAAVLTEDIGYMRSQVRGLSEDTNELHQRSHYVEWNARTNDRGRAGVVDMLAELADFGFAWRDIAKLVGVSVPAIQKWRKGERTTGPNRHKIASVLAACDLIMEHHGVQEIASWFEMPLLAGVPVTPLDLWHAERSDLVFECASGHEDPAQMLTEFDPGWRDRYRSDFEAFRAADGNLSIRAKGN